MDAPRSPAEPQLAGEVDAARLALSLGRLRLGAVLLLPLFTGHLVYFALPPDPAAGPERLAWRALLLGSHVGMLLLAAAILGAALAALRPPRPGRWARHLPAAAALLLLCGAGWIAVADQLITTAITPWVLGTLGVALALRLSTSEALVAHLGGLCVLVASALATRAPSDQRASLLLNAATTAALGLLLSVSLTRAFDRAARARRIIEQQRSELETLRGLLRVCAVCKSIKNESGAWEPIEAYVSRHTEARFSHGLCEACFERHYGGLPHEEPPGG